MELSKNPQGDVYEISLEGSGSIVVPFGSVSFSVGARVKNCSIATWDTSDLLRLAVMLIGPEHREETIPPFFIEDRLEFPQQFIPPLEEVVFRIEVNINLIPMGHYLLLLDLVVENKYFLGSTGGRRQFFPVDIVNSKAGEVGFHTDIRIPPAPPSRAWLADLRAPPTNNAFQLIEGLGLVQHRNKIGSGSKREILLISPLTYKKVIVKYYWGPFFVRHYSHFLEFLVCLHAICCEYIGNVDEIIIFIGDQQFTAQNRPDVQRFLLDSVFKKWTVLPYSDDSIPDGVTYYIDFNGHRQNTPINRLVVDYFDVVLPWIGSFKTQCLSNATNLYCRSDRKTAVYAKRVGRRTLSEKAEAQLLSVFIDFGYEIVDVDFGELTIEEQINIANNASIMFGVHGNNLTNCMWLPKGAALLEIFPVGFQSFDYQIFCEISGVSYLGIEAKALGFVHRDGTRLPGWTLLDAPYNTGEHHMDSIEFIPISVVKSFLRNAF